MLRDEVGELHYITHTENLASIARHGLLSHKSVSGMQHVSVALQSVQDRRAAKKVPNGRSLHEYVNVYFHCRNPMMYRLIASGAIDLAVIRVSEAVLDIPGVIITDGNAAADTTRFMPVATGLGQLDKSRVHAKWWTSLDPIHKAELKRQRCAEVLVPDKIAPECIIGCYLHDEAQVAYCRRQVSHWTMEVRSNEFFK